MLACLWNVWVITDNVEVMPHRKHVYCIFKELLAIHRKPNLILSTYNNTCVPSPLSHFSHQNMAWIRYVVYHRSWIKVYSTSRLARDHLHFLLKKLQLTLNSNDNYLLQHKWESEFGNMTKYINNGANHIWYDDIFAFKRNGESCKWRKKNV